MRLVIRIGGPDNIAHKIRTRLFVRQHLCPFIFEYVEQVASEFLHTLVYPIYRS